MRIADPYAGSGVFRRAQLHVHTRRSDGRLEPEDLLARYRDAGYAFVCLTDHDRVTMCDTLNGAGFCAVPGIEETIVRGIPPLGPHLGRLFARRRLGEGTVQERLDRTRGEGGIPVLNHPSWTGNLWSAQWTLPAMEALRGSFLLEIVNPHSKTEEDVRRWTALLAGRGRDEPVGAVAVDDTHAPAQMGRGWVMVRVAAVTAEELRRALQAMAFYATTGPEMTFIVEDGRLRCGGPVDEVAFIDRQGTTRARVLGGEAAYRPLGDEGFVRVEAWGSAGRAWSQPFWIEVEDA